MDRSTIHSIYFVGIKGVGVSAMALVAQGLGYSVIGSDTAEEFITDAPLLAAGITPLVGFRADNLPAEVDLVVVGAAYGDDNPEVAAARSRHITVWSSSEFLGYLSEQKKTIAVAGTHGKTTTTSLLAYLLYTAGWQPSYLIGTGQVYGLPAHGGAGSGEYFVAEADDYKRSPTDPQPKFLDLTPYAAIITSIEHDHPDLFPTLQDCIEAFYQLTRRVRPDGFLLINSDDPNVTQLRKRLTDRRLIGYGFEAGADYQIISDQPGQFSLQTAKQSFGPFKLSLPGRHNLYNAAAAVSLALELGVDAPIIQEKLPLFQTVERRFQIVGQAGGITVIDDYAHHPTAVHLTLETAREQYPNRPIWCFFQSHTYSRTKALLKEFGMAFGSADAVIVTDIFASAREQAVTVTVRDLIDEIKKHHKNVTYVPFGELLDYMQQNLPPNAVVITMGAGDIYKVGRQLVETTQSNQLPDLKQAEPLSRHSTMRVGGPAVYFVVAKTVDELVQAVTTARQQSMPYHILGGGSNTLFADSGYDGWIIKDMANKVEISGQPVENLEAVDYASPPIEARHQAADPKKYISFLDLDYQERPGDTLVKAESGVNLTALIVKTLDAGLTGLHWFGGIPGIIGGAVYNNIHGGTHLIGERLVEVEALTVDNQRRIYAKNELDLAYDYSRFHQSGEVILSASFLLTKATAAELDKAEYTYREWVKRKSQMQPQLGSMGSTFQNVAPEVREKAGAPTAAAGWFIDQCGLKGKQLGQAQIAPEHANFIINLGGATAADVYQLMELMKKSVKQKFGVDLTEEVRLIGDFGL